ncbi:MAG: deoxyguanosinetriphosphate triphosphohydrolase [Planctomycetes bacterium]|nr:deoxyguanosinetriphosphate triphosphohydrolase [Planctomycetota bacterium]
MKVIREKLEQRESEELAPWGMKSAETRGRRYEEPEHPYRTAYQRDRDRIVHCKAFRRLEYKTQVFLNHEGDHYRTRLTHTLEVAQIGRTIARALGLNEDLTEAIALAHDVGHTPFGHSGETALREAMSEHGGFEHNRHGLRVVDLLESQYPGFPGLNLTHEVREGIIKHSTRWDNPDVPGKEQFDPGPPLLEAQAVELADSIAYDNHDLEDGLAAEILNEKDLYQLSLWSEAAKKCGGDNDALSAEKSQRECVRYLINLFVTDLLENTWKEIERQGIKSPTEARQVPESIVCFSDGLKDRKKQLEGYLFEELYRNYRVMTVTNSAKRFVLAIFDELIEDPRELPPEHQQWSEEVGIHQAVCDYVAGMTDRYAQDRYLQMFQPYQKL